MCALKSQALHTSLRSAAGRKAAAHKRRDRQCARFLAFPQLPAHLDREFKSNSAPCLHQPGAAGATLAQHTSAALPLKLAARGGPERRSQQYQALVLRNPLRKLASCGADAANVACWCQHQEPAQRAKCSTQSRNLQLLRLSRGQVQHACTLLTSALPSGTAGSPKAGPLQAPLEHPARLPSLLVAGWPAPLHIQRSKLVWGKARVSVWPSANTYRRGGAAGGGWKR